MKTVDSQSSLSGFLDVNGSSIPVPLAIYSQIFQSNEQVELLDIWEFCRADILFSLKILALIDQNSIKQGIYQVGINRILKYLHESSVVNIVASNYYNFQRAQQKISLLGEACTFYLKKCSPELIYQNLFIDSLLDQLYQGDFERLGTVFDPCFSCYHKIMKNALLDIQEFLPPQEEIINIFQNRSPLLLSKQEFEIKEKVKFLQNDLCLLLKEGNKSQIRHRVKKNITLIFSVSDDMADKIMNYTEL